MNVLVTGGAGFIGSHIIRHLVKAGHCPIVVDDLSSGHRQAVPQSIPLYTANIGDVSFLEALFKNYSVDAVIHCAAFVNVNESVMEPSKYYQNNIAHSIHLLRACEKAGVRFFIFSSSAAVYGQPEGATLVSETSPLNPMSPYGETKLMFEKVLQDSCSSPLSQMKYVALRYFNVAGAHMEGETGQSTEGASHLIQVACEVASGRRSHIEMYGTDYPTRDGTCIRDFIHVEDLAAAHVQTLDYLKQGGESDVFNCGYGQGFSVREVLNTMKKVSGLDLKIIESDRRLGDPAKLTANSEKLKKTLNWVPQFNDLSVICDTALKWEHKLKGGIYGKVWEEVDTLDPQREAASSDHVHLGAAQEAFSLPPSLPLKDMEDRLPPQPPG